ncbi:MAG: ParB N-terminal domain-containing protein [Candidatus Thorarchaeota archaeon]
MGVIIETPQLLMEIELVSIDSLFIHEETIASALEKLEKEIVAEQILKHPIIVDSDTLVVLDGMHRVAALRTLNYKLAPVCLVDYQNPSIEVNAWYREFIGDLSLSEFSKEISAKDLLDTVQTSSNKAFDLVKNRKTIAALAIGKNAVLLNSTHNLSIKEIYDEIAKIESLGQELGFKLIYSTESDALQSIESALRTVLIVPSLTKKEVISSALNQEIFTQKTTRHVVPARPLFVNVPLHWLEQSNLEIANQRLRAHLKKKQILKKSPGTIINGRRYEEYTYLFSDS